MPERKSPNPALPNLSPGQARLTPSEGDVYAAAYLARAKAGATASHAVMLMAGNPAASEGLLWEQAFLSIKHPL